MIIDTCKSTIPCPNCGTERTYWARTLLGIYYRRCGCGWHGPDHYDDDSLLTFLRKLFRRGEFANGQ